MTTLTVQVRVYHNVATEPAGNRERPVGMLDGYQADHPVTHVFATTYPADMSHTAILEHAYMLLNVGDDPDFGTPDPRAQEYRFRRNRSMSKGDVVRIDDTWYACASFGWTPIDRPRVEAVTMHGTNPLPEETP